MEEIDWTDKDTVLRNYKPSELATRLSPLLGFRWAMRDYGGTTTFELYDPDNKRAGEVMLHKGESGGVLVTTVTGEDSSWVVGYKGTATEAKMYEYMKLIQCYAAEQRMKRME